jgi:hypothetical protein
LDPLKFGTRSPRRPKSTLIYRRTGNLRAHRALCVTEIDDAIEIAEKIDV